MSINAGNSAFNWLSRKYIIIKFAPPNVNGYKLDSNSCLRSPLRDFWPTGLAQHTPSQIVSLRPNLPHEMRWAAGSTTHARFGLCRRPHLVKLQLTKAKVLLYYFLTCSLRALGYESNLCISLSGLKTVTQANPRIRVSKACGIPYW